MISLTFLFQDWSETPSDSSSINGESANMTDFHGKSENHKASAQKKYRFFGKNKVNELKDSECPTEAESVVSSIPSTDSYFVEYPQPVANYGSSEVGYIQPVSYNPYYSVAHNHSYGVQPAEMTSNFQWNQVLTDNEQSTEKPHSDGKTSAASSSKKSNDRRKVQPVSYHPNDTSYEAQLNRDEKRARQLKIPICTHDIINLPIDEFNERITKYELTEIQLSLIRDIRRRGTSLFSLRQFLFNLILQVKTRLQHKTVANVN